MISFALHNLRHRKASFAGAFLALLCAAALVCAFGTLLETGLRGTVSAARYAGTPVIVAGDQNVRETIRKSEDKVKVKAKPIAERAWIAAGLAGRLREVPGVTSVVTEVTFPAYLTGESSGTAAEPGASASQVSPPVPLLGHGWESAALTPSPWPKAGRRGGRRSRHRRGHRPSRGLPRHDPVHCHATRLPGGRRDRAGAGEPAHYLLLHGGGPPPG
ncbi:hypothetical protein ACFQX6_55935 [Streptosporangium lutulentum]